MKSVFALFESYVDCRDAVEDFLQADFDDEEINVIVDAEVARSHMDVNLERAGIEATDVVGEEATGLDIFLGAERPMEVHPLGNIYAAGEIATVLANAAAAPDTTGIEQMLEEFGVPSSKAGVYVETVATGGLIFWIRVDDDCAAKARKILRKHNGFDIVSYGG
jgi:hypothetical protein